MGANYMCLLLVILVTSPVYCTRLRRPQDAEKSPLFLYGRLFQDDVRLYKECCSTCGQGSEMCRFCRVPCPSESFCKDRCSASQTCCCSKS